MIIRSQNKCVIENFDNECGVYIKEDGREFCVETSRFFLGAYSTEEKALKVLDMIQEAYLGTTKMAISNDGEISCLPIARVFQMPQDDEV